MTKRKVKFRRELKIKASAPAHKIKFYIYQDVNNEYRWRLLTANNRVIADSGEGYKNQADVLASIELLMDTDRSTVIVDKQNVV